MDEPEQLQDETNLIDRLLTRASSHATQRLHTFLSEGETEAGHLTYETLDRHARAIAVDLQRKIGEGERALLLYPPGLDFICAFFGCLYAGIVAIPAPLPHRARLQRSLPRLQCLIEDSGTSLVLTDTAHLPELEALAFLAGLSILATDGQPPDEHEAGEWRGPCINEDTLAYLQYTSGSTSEPKGVMVRHGDLFRHCGHTARAWGYGPDSVAATWLPHFHDYGLVDGIIQPLFTGIPVYMMSPVAFVVRPERWLKAISHYGVTHSQAPNFGYELCAQRIKPAERERLNLGRWATASTGHSNNRTCSGSFTSGPTWPPIQYAGLQTSRCQINSSNTRVRGPPWTAIPPSRCVNGKAPMRPGPIQSPHRPRWENTGPKRRPKVT